MPARWRDPGLVVLRYAQDAAWVHSAGAGFGREWYRERGLTWLVRCVDLEVLGPSRPGETLTVTTEVVGLRRVWARRRGEVLGPDGRRVAAILTDWVMTGPGFAPVRVPTDLLDVFRAVPDAFEPSRVRLAPTPAEAHRRGFHVRRSEIDPMAHVNNAAYVDYLEESLAEAGAGAALDLRPRRYRLEYLQSAEPRAELTGAAWCDGVGWAYRLSDATGVELLRARFSAAQGA